MGMLSIILACHPVCKSFWESSKCLGFLWVDDPFDWSILSIYDNVVEGINFVFSKDDGDDFMSLADADDWPVFALDVFHEFGVVEDPFGSNIIWMLLTFWGHELKCATCK